MMINFDSLISHAICKTNQRKPVYSFHSCSFQITSNKVKGQGSPDKQCNRMSVVRIGVFFGKSVKVLESCGLCVTFAHAYFHMRRKIWWDESQVLIHRNWICRAPRTRYDRIHIHILYRIIFKSSYSYLNKSQNPCRIDHLCHAQRLTIVSKVDIFFKSSTSCVDYNLCSFI